MMKKLNGPAYITLMKNQEILLNAWWTQLRHAENAN